MFMRKALRLRDTDWLLLGLAVVISILGIVEIYSTTAETALAGQVQKQIGWVLVGALLALGVSRVDYHRVFEQVPWLYAGTLLALGALFVVGPTIAGTRRWIVVGGQSFQVSEMAKLVIIITVAAYFADRHGKFVTWKDFVKLGALVLVPAILVALEPDLGTALTLLPIGAAGFFLAGVRLRHVLVLALLAALTLPLGWHFLKPYQRERLVSFVHPSADMQGASYQATQSKIAIGSGGLWGKGIGRGTQSRLGFVPVSHADFIFAAFAEEQGFVGTLVVLLLYFLLLLRLLDGAQTAGDRAGAYFLVGLAAVLFFQVVVNIGMMIGIVPVTGIPLPLMSQGGSSVVFTFVSLGLAMSVRMRRLVN